jgi:hypothetical protein
MKKPLEASSAESANEAVEKKDTVKAATQEPEHPVKKEEKAAPPAWVADMTAPQEVIVVFVKSRIDYNKMKRIYTNYTMNNFPKDSLNVEMDDLFEGYKNITISGFKSAEQAKNFSRAIKGNPILIRDIQRKEHYIWVITPENRETLIQNKDLKGYDEFFKKEY